MTGFATVLLVRAALASAPGPALPPGVAEGGIVVVDGVVYQRHGDRLYTLDDPVLDEAAAIDDAPSSTAITVTGSRLDARQADKVLHAESIGADTIVETGARTLADVLQEQGGLQVNSNRGLGAEVMMDGLDGRHVLILVDGRPVVGKVDNRVDVSRLPISASSIERIEIVRGPMSALYGSDGIAGVINIITKKPTAQGRVELELGGQAIPTARNDGTTLDGWTTMGLHVGGGAGPLALRLDVTGANLPGYDRGGRDTGADVQDGRSDLPDRRNGAAQLDAVVVLDDDWSLRATLSSTIAQNSAALSPALPYRDAAENTDSAIAVAATGVVDAGLARPVDVTADLRVDRFTHRFFALPRGDANAAPPFCDTAFAPACPAAPRTRTAAMLDQARFELRADAVLLDAAPTSDASSDASSGVSSGVSSRAPSPTAGATSRLSASLGVVALREIARRTDGDGADTLPGGGERATASSYVEVLWRPLPFVALLPGARFDAFVVDGDGSDGAFALGPKLATRVDLPAGFSLRASVGQGFRLPSFEERFLRFDHSELGYVVQGNPALRPERSTGARVELAFSRPRGSGAPSSSSSSSSSSVVSVPLEAGIELSGNALTDLITEQAAGTTAAGIPLFSYGNASRAWTAALSTRAKVGPVQAAAVALSLDATWQYLLNAVDASGCPADDPWFCGADAGARSLPLRPAHAVDVTARATLSSTSTTFFARADLMSERPLPDAVAPGSVVLACGVRQPIELGAGDGAELMVGLENLLDQTDPVYGPKPGRHVSVNLRVW